MKDRLIHGLIAAAIAYGVTNSKFVALIAFGAVAGLSGNQWGWWKEIVEELKKEAEKAKGKAAEKVEQSAAGSGTITHKHSAAALKPAANPVQNPAQAAAQAEAKARRHAGAQATKAEADQRIENITRAAAVIA